MGIDHCSEEDGHTQNVDDIINTIDINFPPKEQLTKLIKPCSTENRMLLSVIDHNKFKNLLKKETKDELMKRVNRKSTNSRTIINDKRTSITEDMMKEIVNYHVSKEDSMMSLMMELILSDVDCEMDDIVETNDNIEVENEKKRPIPTFLIDSSDLDNNSLCNNYLNPPGEGNYLQASDRSNILSSIGLSEEDKSIQSICEETFEMHQQLTDIKKSFQEDENKVNDLLKQACALKNDLRETLYLNDTINLLGGDIQKVKLKKLPFKILHQHSEGHDELNLII